VADDPPLFEFDGRTDLFVCSIAANRAGLRPTQQARVLDRDHRCCVICGRSATELRLTVAHLVSVDDGRALGLTDDEINDDMNLAAMCEACNSGFNRRSVSAATLARLLAAAVRAGTARREGLDITPLA
jgi:5-methylcytosine-specific restriction endonuclease McrA